MVQRLPFLPVLVASAIVLLALTVAYYPPRRRLLASASTDRSAYVSGESVNISITLLAKGTAPITLRIDCDLAGFDVDNESGATIYHSIDFCLAAPWSLTLRPGQGASLRFTWLQVDDHGFLVSAQHAYEIRPGLGFSPPCPVTLTAARIFVG